MASRPSVFITRRIPSVVLSRLETACEVDVYAGEQPIEHDELKRRAANAEAVMCLLTERIDREVLDAALRLRIVANIAVGYDNIDVGYATSRSIVVTNTPDVLTEAVADYTWALILALTRRVSEGERLVRRGDWSGWALDFMLGSELTGKQLGIVGMGRIGRAVARRAPAFGMRVAFADRPGGSGTDASQTQPGPPSISEPAAMSLDELLSTSHVVSLHVPATPSTHHLIDRRALLRMRRSAYLVNTARGSVIDENALVWALSERLIAGAALDVYEHEPQVPAPLLSMEHVLVSPHLGSATTETRTAMADLAARNVLAVLAGHPPLTPVP